ncbi:hypothetical protein BKA65DRAFT_578911 [Rhexocercosporidium sp. MPI-PUGE-AT-0058]|nr:hypothetical protein BKA65DRAFT_578911 [Rhexocercosporidium sp. MPI-PUGE-AT-0058]
MCPLQPDRKAHGEKRCPRRRRDQDLHGAFLLRNRSSGVNHETFRLVVSATPKAMMAFVPMDSYQIEIGQKQSRRILELQNCNFPIPVADEVTADMDIEMAKTQKNRLGGRVVGPNVNLTLVAGWIKLCGDMHQKTHKNSCSDSIFPGIFAREIKSFLVVDVEQIRTDRLRSLHLLAAIKDATEVPSQSWLDRAITPIEDFQGLAHGNRTSPTIIQVEEKTLLEVIAGTDYYKVISNSVFHQSMGYAIGAPLQETVDFHRSTNNPFHSGPAMSAVSMLGVETGQLNSSRRSSMTPVNYSDLDRDSVNANRERHLAFQSDILGAFSGLCQALSTIGTAEFHWGLPVARFQEALCW